MYGGCGPRSEGADEGCYDSKGAELSQVKGCGTKLTLARIGLDDSSDWGISNDGVSATIDWSRMCRTCERGTKEQKAAGV
jgi:hypothetical protein